MSNRNLTIGVVVAVVLAITAFFFPKVANTAYGAVQSGVDVTTTYFTTLAVSNGISNGGIFTSPYRTATLTAATTTPCAIQSPNATSTVASASLLLTTSSTTASTVTIASAATAYATTTYLGSTAISANAQGTAYTAATSSQAVLGPSQWVVFGMSGGTGTFSPAGVCEATFQVLN
jgi:hypothetical protein